MRRLLAVTLAAVLASSCCERTYPEPFDPTGPDPTYIDILPEHVMAAPGSQFVVEARLWSDGHLIPATVAALNSAGTGYVPTPTKWQVEWEPGPTQTTGAASQVTVAPLGSNGRRALVTVAGAAPGGASTASVEFEIQASWEGLAATGTVEILSGPGSTDVGVELSQPAGDQPGILMYDVGSASAQQPGSSFANQGGVSAVDDALLAYVDRASVSTSGGASALRLAGFAADRRAILLEAQPGAGSTLVLPGAAPDTIWAFVWVPALDGSGEPRPDSDLQKQEDLIDAELALGNRILRANRVGIRLKRSGGIQTLGGVSVHSDIVTDGTACGDRSQLIPFVGSSALDAGVFRALYLPGAPEKGVWCLPPDDYAVLNPAVHNATTLVHEFGHAADLPDESPTIQSVAIETLFGDNNLMSVALVTESVNGTNRDHLAIGQTFRVNWNKESIIHRARRAPHDPGAPLVRPGGGTIQCLPYGSDPVCPDRLLDLGSSPGSVSP